MQKYDFFPRYKVFATIDNLFQMISFEEIILEKCLRYATSK